MLFGLRFGQMLAEQLREARRRLRQLGGRQENARELRPAADAALEGQQVRSGVSAPVRLAVTTPESDSQNVLTVEGQVLQPQLALAHHCLY